MIHYHSPKSSKRFITRYDPLEPRFVAPGFYSHTLKPSLELHTHNENKIVEVLQNIYFPDRKKINIHIYNLPYNLEGFYNGFASSELKYNKGEIDYQKSTFGVLLLGRTTSIPLVMTEFVLPHEIGHCYQYRYLPDNGKDKSNWNKFLQLMKLSKFSKKSLSHSEDHGEIFANTFRILFSPYQHDFWPHPCIHPLKVRGLKEFLMSVIK
jgi:hypothetical protein